MTATPAHLDDSRLSAVVDGKAPAADLAHTEGCERCRTRLAALRAAAALVASPPPPPDPARREAAIAAALDALPGRSPHPLVPRRRPAWIVPAAAAVAALAALGGLALGRSRMEGSDEDAARTVRAGEAVEEQEATAAPTPTDLGALGPASDLEATVSAALREGTAAALAEGGTQRREEARSAPDAPDAGDVDAARCEDVARADDPRLGPLRLRAAATWEGQPAVVLAVDVVEVTDERTRVLVLARDGCALLARRTYPRLD
jgi:hypothetical protein